MPLRPLGQKVILQQVKPEQVTPGGIVLPEAAQESKSVGTVIACGPKVSEEIDVDDVVLYSPFAGAEIEYYKEPYIILSEEDIHAVEE